MSSLTEEVDALFQEWDTTHTPGCSLLIAQYGEPLYRRSYGMANIERAKPITRESIFHVGSISKQFMAMVIALLAQDSKLSLDDDIHLYLPEIPNYGFPITIKQLIYQMHGLRDQEELLYLAGWRDEDIKTNLDAFSLIIRQNQLHFQPGEKREYNSTGYTCLALIAERVSGQPLSEVADKMIFRPLNMRHTHFHDDPTVSVEHSVSSYFPAQEGKFSRCIHACYLVGTAGLYTTADDLLQWTQNFYSHRVGGKDIIKQMLTPGVLNDGTSTDYAFGNYISSYRGLKIIKHAGADIGYRARLTWCPEHQFTVILLANLSTLKQWELSRKILDLYLTEYLQPLCPQDLRWERKAYHRLTTKELGHEQLALYTGIYYSKELNVIYTIYQQEKHLMVTRQRFADVSMVPTDKDTFIINVWSERIDRMVLTFVRKGQSSILGFNIATPHIQHLWFKKIEDV